MGLTQDMERLSTLIEERENHGDMKALLITIQDQMQALQEENTTITTQLSAVQIKLSQAETRHREEIARMNKETEKLKSEIQQLKSEDAPPPTLKINIGKFPRQPI